MDLGVKNVKRKIRISEMKNYLNIYFYLFELKDSMINEY